MSEPDALAAPEQCTADLASIQVAVGVMQDIRGRVLLSRRGPAQRHAGAWEFPGGKLNPGESANEALRRELFEELGISVIRASPWMRIPWHYPGQRVELLVFKVHTWHGEAQGREGQSVQWLEVAALSGLNFPAANHGIVQALRLPARYLITPEPDEPEQFLLQLRLALAGDIRLAQYRAKGLPREPWLALGQRVLAMAEQSGVTLMVNASPADARALKASGLHLSSARLMSLTERPGGFACCAASCHTPAEIDQAARLGLDFIVLGPVLATASHPGQAGLGWALVDEWTRLSPVPVYLVGGLGEADLALANRFGAQGIAAIRAWWPG